jgi:hypothetical protein
VFWRAGAAISSDSTTGSLSVAVTSSGRTRAALPAMVSSCPARAPSYSAARFPGESREAIRDLLGITRALYAVALEGAILAIALRRRKPGVEWSGWGLVRRALPPATG